MRRPPAEQLALGLEAATPAGPVSTPSPSAPPLSPHAEQDSSAPAAEHPLALADALARRRIAEELDLNLLVEAGAGSGKTTALVSRMVALVREGAAQVTEIAAVTFTRKAAGELRERFQEALERELARSDLLGSTRARLELALQDLDRSFMGTIHAFCARLLRERPLEAGIDPGFSELTAVEANLAAARFWGLHLERLAVSGDPILGELEDMGLAPMDLRGLYETLRDNLDVEFPLETAPPLDPSAIAQVRAELDELLDEALRLIPREPPEGDWDELQKRLRSVCYVRRFRPWVDDRVFLDALAELCSRTAWKITQYKWSGDKAGTTAARNLAARVNALAAGQAGRLLEEWRAYRYPVAMRFALGAAQALAAHRLTSGTLDFQDLLSLAARLLRESPAARADLGRRWKRLLVDEFQDTDPIQAEVLFLLASDPAGEGDDWTWAVPRPGALFVVGDPKQSIYRFRRADISLYMRVRERFREWGGVESLVANFRSGAAIATLVNDVFAPPHGFPEEGEAIQAAFAPLLPELSRRRPAPAGVFHYDVRSQTSSRELLTGWDALAVADWIARRTGPAGDRAPGDFLILTRAKEPLEAYARALEARNLPVQVSGAGVGVQDEVAELRLLLEALADPDDPSKTVAVLVGLFFGIDHERLLEHREAGLTFDFRNARAGEAGPVEEALARMRGWWQRARREPADVVVARIVSELGLLPYAAAGELGGVRAGALAYVLDAVRGSGPSGDTSLAGALGALDAALRDDEAEAPLQPGRSDQVRLMNVHKAKGLEAKVVILAAPLGEREHPVERHIERGPDGRARGWMAVERRQDRYSTRVLARPHAWAEKEAAERAFQDAEDLRLLYVAVTRAQDELVVARHQAKPDLSPWRRLDSRLDRGAVRLEVSPTPASPRDSLESTAAELRQAGEAAGLTRRAGATPTHAFASVTHVAKTAGRAGPALASEPLSPDPGDGPGGYAWGSAVHGMLEAAARGATGARLRAVARALLLELDRPLENGEPVELEDLLATSEGVLRSELWRRSRKTPQALAEVPFAVLLDTDPPEGSAPPTWMEGVLDLAFREADGWVIVDYKTDRGDDPDFPGRRAAYREQLRLYGKAWEHFTGETVKERLLWFVRGGEVERVERE